MRKFVLFLLLMAVLPISAKKYIPGEPWPEKGYNLYSYAPEFNASLQRFADVDTMYYLKMPVNYRKPNGDFYFMTVTQQAADSILTYTLTDKVFQKPRHRSRWLIYLLRDTGAADPMNNTEWTLYHQNNNNQFSASIALESYQQQRTPKKKPEFSPEAWAHFLNQAGFVLRIMGGGADTRTLYDKVMQDGGY